MVEEVDGRLQLADARRPGCEVVVREISNPWVQDYDDNIGQVASFAAGWQEIADLEVKYGKTLRIQTQISNTLELKADLRGPCGPNVVTSVLVGRGWREVQYAKEVSGKAGLDIVVGSAETKVAVWEKIGSRMGWTESQAWAFTLGDGNGEILDITVDMPPEMISGQKFMPAIQVGRAMWLIVVNRDAKGNHRIVYPSPGLEPEQLMPNDQLALPSMDASIVTGQTTEFSEIIVYGFGEAGDFKQLAPPAGAIPCEQVNEYVAELNQRLNDPDIIPPSRWASTTFGYQVTETNGREGMVRIEGGSFDGHTIEAFDIDETEVTVAAYRMCVDAGMCEVPASDSTICNWTSQAKRHEHPVNCVSAIDGDAYCHWMGRRLPTEWEWEWAARGRSEGNKYPWGSETPGSQACWNRKQGTCAVGSFTSGVSVDGVLDLAGNVWEWTASVKGANRIVRGGSWSDTYESWLTASIRGDVDPTYRSNVNGFRCAKSVE